MKTVKFPDYVSLVDIAELCRRHKLKLQWMGNGVYKAVHDSSSKPRNTTPKRPA